MEPGQSGHTAGAGTPGGAGPAVATATSTPAAPGTKSLEELMRDQDSMRRSIADLTSIKSQQETRIKELEAQVASAAPPGEMGADEYLTVAQAKEIARQETEAILNSREQAQRAQYDQQVAFATERQSWLDRAATDIPESLDKTSPVYKKAVELFNDPAEGLARHVNGNLVPTYANAEYVAFSRAKMLMGGSTTTAQEKRDGAAFASTGTSAGGPSPAVHTELSDEEFLKLSEEDKVKYRERKFAEKFPGK